MIRPHKRGVVKVVCEGYRVGIAERVLQGGRWEYSTKRGLRSRSCKKIRSRKSGLEKVDRVSTVDHEISLPVVAESGRMVLHYPTCLITLGLILNLLAGKTVLTTCPVERQKKSTLIAGSPHQCSYSTRQRSVSRLQPWQTHRLVFQTSNCGVSRLLRLYVVPQRVAQLLARATLQCQCGGDIKMRTKLFQFSPLYKPPNTQIIY